jgi:hypothetical protein
VSHLPSLTLDALELGALAPDERVRAERHLGECARCREDHAALKASRARFSERVFPATLPKILGRRQRWWRRPLVFAVAPALAALALVVWLRPAEESLVAEKGGPTLQVFARRAGRVSPVKPRAVLQAGDEIRFVVDPAGLSQLLIASVDGDGKVSVYFPYGGTGSAPVRPGRNELPGSIVLDASRGPERLFAVLSAEPIEAAPVTRALGELGRRGPEAIREARRLPLSTTQLSLVFEKSP